MKLTIDRKLDLELEVKTDSPEERTRVKAAAKSVKAAYNLAVNAAKRTNPDLLAEWRRWLSDMEATLQEAIERGDVELAPDISTAKGRLPQAHVPEGLFDAYKRCVDKAYAKLNREAAAGKAPTAADEAWVEAALDMLSNGKRRQYDPDDGPTYRVYKPHKGTFPVLDSAQSRYVLATHIAGVALGKVAEIDPTQLAPIADAFPGMGGSGWLPNNPFTHSGLSALMSGGSQARQIMGGWKHDEGQKGPEYHQPQRDQRASLSYSIEAETVAEMWRVIEEEYDDFAAQVAVACLAQITAKAPPPYENYMHLDLEALKKYMQAHQLRGSNRDNFHERVVRTMRALNRLQVRARIPSPQDSTTLIPVRGPFMAVNEIEDELEQPDLFEVANEHSPSPALPSRWLIRPGLWSEHWKFEGKEAWLAEFAQEWLGQKRDLGTIMARRIATLVLGAAGGTRHRKTWLPFTIEDMLLRIRLLPYPEARGQHWGGRTRDALETALELLKKSEDLERVTWPKGYGPADKSRPRGWVERWLKAEVQLLTPEALKHLNEAAKSKTTEPKKGKGNSPKAAAWGDEHIAAVRERMAAKDWTQAQLARYLGVKPAALSQVLNGARKPSKTMRPKLDAFVGERK